VAFDGARRIGTNRPAVHRRRRAAAIPNTPCRSLFLQRRDALKGCVFASEPVGETFGSMAEAKKPSKPALVPRAQTGADLRAWRLLVGLLAREIADLIDVSERSVLRAERSARPTGKVLAGFERLQGLLLEGKLDIRPLLRRRWSRGTTKTQKSLLTGHAPRKVSGRNMTSGSKKPRQTGQIL
jgi:hypothetical protein